MTDRKSRDSIYATPQDMLVDFAFDEKVASVFPDMIRRSVPGYDNIISLIGLLARHFQQENTHVYDLGCSLGAATLSIMRRIETPCHIIAVDNSPEMIKRCEENLATETSPASVEVLCEDIRNIAIQQASFAVMNFTLQFIPPEQRFDMLNDIHQGMLPGGALVLSEKITFSEESERDFHIQLHHEFKKANGYSDLEISQKRSALENVLIPDTLLEHMDRLRVVGFREVIPWFQCFNFISLLAIK